MKITEAREYINFNISEGVWSPEQFEGWTDEQIIEFAQKNMDWGDNWSDDKDDDINN
jgi:hypothetical protein